MMLTHRQPMQQIGGCLSIDGDLFFPIFICYGKNILLKNMAKQEQVMHSFCV